MSTATIESRLLAALIRDRRSSAALARLSGLHPVSVRRLRSGDFPFGQDAIAKLAPVLGFRLNLEKLKSEKISL